MSPIIEQIRDQIRGAWRFRWWALAVAWIVALGGWLGVFAMPDRYEAGASVFVDTRTPLTPALQGLTMEQDVNAQLNLVRQSLLAGSELEKLARSAGILPDSVVDVGRRGKILDQVQQNIQITVRSANDREDARTAGTIYDIVYQDPDQGRCLRLVEIMLKTFVEQTLGGKREGSLSAQQFLETQVHDYETRLRAAEDQLAAFKSRHLGLMPSERGGYFAQLQKETETVTDLQAKLRTAENRRATLQGQLRGDAAVSAVGGGPSAVVGAGGVSAGNDTVSRIAETQAHLDELLLKFTDKHPDVIAARETLEELKKRRVQEIESLRRGDANAVAVSRASANPVYQSIQLALNQAELDVADLRSQLGDHQAKVQELKQLVTTAPQVEAEYAQLSRDYDVNKAQYTALLGNLEKTRLGERASDAGSVRFDVVQPPAVSYKPVAPKRSMLLLAMLMAGFGAGGALAYGLDRMYPVVGSGSDLSQLAGVPVLGAVGSAFPSLTSRQTRRDVGLMVAVAACLVAGFLVALFLSRDGYRINITTLTHMGGV
ncbi:MAG TPA: XrtA system polysaccharide chain length determinant [Steroidobacteraceae bacterium]|nr:XrtA system polysaccharide chain length determinant [Steroidobacteraceae bacterium]